MCYVVYECVMNSFADFSPEKNASNDMKNKKKRALVLLDLSWKNSFPFYAS